MSMSTEHEQLGSAGCSGKGQTWSARALSRQGTCEVPCAAVAGGGCPGCMNARRQLWGDLLLHIVPQHGKDLLHKGV